MYVKEHFSTLKAVQPEGTSHAELMKELGKRYKASKEGGRPAEGAGGSDGLYVEDEADVCEVLPLSRLRL